MAFIETTLLWGFFEYQLEVRKLSRRSVIDMKCTYRALQEFCTAQGIQAEIWSLSFEEYVRWVNWLRDKGAKRKSINKMLSQVRTLIDYCWQIEKLNRNVLDGFHVRNEDPTPVFDQLSIEEAQRLMAAYGKNSKGERRNRAVMILLYGCGLRNQELCDLDVTSVDLDRQELQVSGKGPKQRVVPLSSAVYSELLAYLRDRSAKRGPLFKTEIKHARIRQRNVSDIVDGAVLRAKLGKRVTPKTFRHAFASHLLDQGVDISVISMLMGHRSPSETGVYIHAQTKNLESAIFQLPPTKEGK